MDQASGHPAEVLANSIAYVDQDIFLFEGTVRDNLTLWTRRLRGRALKRAQGRRDQDDIAMRAGTYDSHVNEGGTNFSGGQRQRIEIARALVGRPSIIVPMSHRCARPNHGKGHRR